MPITLRRVGFRPKELNHQVNGEFHIFNTTSGYSWFLIAYTKKGIFHFEAMEITKCY